MTVNDIRPEPLGLVAFDLDGTLLRGETVCEVLARPLGRTTEMRRFEAETEDAALRRAREEMAGWYRPHSLHHLRGLLNEAQWAPGAREAVALLQRAGIEIAIASYTWVFAVEWFAAQLNVQHFLGTTLHPSGEIGHVWAADKGTWITTLARKLGVPYERTACVGDSGGDAEMLRAVNLRYSVGEDPIAEVSGVTHLRQGDLTEVAGQILNRWVSKRKDPGTTTLPRAHVF